MGGTSPACVRDAGLTAKPKKCSLAMVEVTYLGHVLGRGKVKPERVKVQAVRDYSRPTTKTQVQSFLGLSGYYRRFIPHYSTIATPLTNLTKKQSPGHVLRTDQCEEAFTKLKEALCTSPVLRNPDYSQQFVVQTDASQYGIGAVLSREVDEGQDHPVTYQSQATGTETEVSSH